jgi:hypothetical protein
MANVAGFTNFLIALCHHRELLDQFHENPEEALAGWNLTPEQREILRRGNLAEIQEEVQRENPDAVAAFWVMAGPWVMADDWVMVTEGEEEAEGGYEAEDADEDEGSPAT